MQSIYQLLHEQANYKLDNGTSVFRSARVLTYEERDEASVYHRVESYEFVVRTRAERKTLVPLSSL